MHALVDAIQRFADERTERVAAAFFAGRNDLDFPHNLPKTMLDANAICSRRIRILVFEPPLQGQRMCAWKRDECDVIRWHPASVERPGQLNHPVLVEVVKQPRINAGPIVDGHGTLLGILETFYHDPHPMLTRAGTATATLGRRAPAI